MAAPYRPPVEENTIKSVHTQIERKTFILTLKENPRGQFLRITEEAGAHHDSIVVPASGLPELHKLLGEMIEVSKQTPPNPLA